MCTGNVAHGVVGRLLSYAEDANDEVATACLREYRHLLRCCRLLDVGDEIELRLRVERSDDAHLVGVLAHLQRQTSGLSLVDDKLLIGGQHAAIGQTCARCEHVGACIERCALTEGVVPTGAAAHVHLPFFEVKQLRSAVVKDASDAEVAVVLRVVEELRGLIVEHQRARLGRQLLSGVEVDVNPRVGTTALVLHLARDDVLLSLDAQRAGQVDEEDVARAGIGDA